MAGRYSDLDQGTKADLHDGWVERQQDKWVRDRIAEVLDKFGIKLPDAPLEALTSAMRRVGAQARNPGQ